ncbi:MAG: GNAT family N-acetyltransferase [Acidimicrobiales bacterium]|jgi:ribosomal protein S18 acetylase RimI-like enzyme
MSEVHLVRPEDVPGCGASLVRAFQDEMMMVYMFPDPRTRTRVLRRFFRLQLQQTAKGRVLAYTTGDCRSTALWIPPRKAPPELRDVIAQLPILFACGRRMGVVMRLFQTLEARHPKTPHYYLGGLGTDPDWQGRGLGSEVIGPVLTVCDRDKVPAYLESAESNAGFYERHGFEVTGEASTPDGSVSLRLMLREPRAEPLERDDS